MTKDGKKDNRGGAREGAGRPKNDPREFSSAYRNRVMKALRAKAKELGFVDEYEALADLALNEKNQDTVRLGAWKLLTDMHVVKESHKAIEITKTERPSIYLPETMPTPAEATQRETDAVSRMH